MSKPIEIVCGVDIGGSHLGVGLYSHLNNKQLCSYEESLSPLQPEQLVELITQIIRRLQKNLTYHTSLISIGIGFPGQSKNGFLVAASNFPDWKMVPLVNMISSKLDNIPATLINDADAAIAAEVWGTDKYSNIRHAAMITLGTGIGFGLILDGRLYSGANGLIEGGHLIIDPHSENKCGCGQRGCIESYASAKNASLKMEKLSLLSHGRESTYSAVIDGSKGIFERADNGDKIAQDLLQEVADYLGVFCINICRLVDPEVIIFGGGMSHAGEKLLKLVRESMLKYTWTVLPTDVRLEIAHQVGDAGMMGAALSAQSLYTHLHPTNPSHSVTANIDHSSEYPQQNSSSSSSSSSSSLLSNDLILAGAISITTGISLLFLTNKSTSITLPFSFSQVNKTNLLIISHAFLVGIHLFGIFSWRNSRK